MAQSETHSGARRDIARIGVLGGGAWGTALACVAARAGNEVTLWAREPEVVDDINSRHRNATFLPDMPLEEAVRATGALEDLAAADAILMVSPAQHSRALLETLNNHLKPGTPVLICSKGIERGTNALLSDVVREACPVAEPCVLSGPSFAADVAAGLPTAVTLACADESLGKTLAAAIGLATFRIYWSPDIVGAQVGGAIKNVLAIACGIVDGKALGESARAALTARGFAEMSRLGQLMGGRPETMTGLSGLGDLILTCNSRKSRNMSLGVALGEGRSLDEILGERKSVSEGVYSAQAVDALAGRFGIEMPISNAVKSIVERSITVDEAIESLLSRPFKSEA